MRQIPAGLAGLAAFLLLASAPTTATAQEIEFCAYNNGVFKARLGVTYNLPGRAIPRDYAGTGFSMGGKRCFTVPRTAESLQIRVDAEIKTRNWKTLCERSFDRAEEAAGLALLAEGSKFDPTCKQVTKTP
jgi:hypothetical protein